jgi:hypothetical protein
MLTLLLPAAVTRLPVAIFVLLLPMALAWLPVAVLRLLSPLALAWFPVAAFWLPVPLALARIPVAVLELGLARVPPLALAAFPVAAFSLPVPPVALALVPQANPPMPAVAPSALPVMSLRHRNYACACETPPIQAASTEPSAVAANKVPRTEHTRKDIGPLAYI